MSDFKEQHVCIMFCFRLQKTCAETCQMLKLAFGDNALGSLRVTTVLNI